MFSFIIVKSSYEVYSETILNYNIVSTINNYVKNNNKSINNCYNPILSFDSISIDSLNNEEIDNIVDKVTIKYS